MSAINNKSVLLGLGLIAAAAIYSKKARAATPAGNNNLAPASLPGSAGSGSKQVVGGALAGLLNSLKTIVPSYDKADPISGMTNSQQQQVDFRKGEILQENANYTTDWATGLTPSDQSQIDFRRFEINQMNVGYE